MSEWRALCIADTFNRVGGGWKGKLVHVSGFLDYLSPAIQELIAPCSLLIFQRNLVMAEAYDAAEYWQVYGKPVVVDLDDAYNMLPWANPAHRFWIENPEGRVPDPVSALEIGLSRMDGLLSPNRNILGDWKHVVRGYHLPNFARSEWWTNMPTREEIKKTKQMDGRTVIGWGGSVSHYDAWMGSGAREAMARVCQRHPEVLLLICGNDPRIPGVLTKRIHKSQLFVQQGVAPEEWPKTVVGFDIGIAPLFGPYDQRRSWLKGLEYLLGGVPWVATQGEPYGDLASLGTLIPNGPDIWEDAIERKITLLKAEQDAAQEKVKVAQQWFVENQLDTYARVYGQIKEDQLSGRGRLAGIFLVDPTQRPDGGGQPQEPPVS